MRSCTTLRTEAPIRALSTSVRPTIMAAEKRTSTREAQVATLADVFELLSAAFSFPTPELAEAICSGAFQSDISECLQELGICNEVPSLDLTDAHTPANLLAEMRKEYSRLFLSPGKLAIIYPYESAFKFVEKGTDEMPTLFITPTTVDVERFWKRAGDLPEDARKEPLDRIDKEFGFLCIAYTNELLALNETRAEDARLWAELARDFREKHIDSWVFAFMEQTAQKTRLKIYEGLAQTALIALACLSDSR